VCFALDVLCAWYPLHLLRFRLGVLCALCISRLVRFTLGVLCAWHAYSGACLNNNI